MAAPDTGPSACPAETEGFVFHTRARFGFAAPAGSDRFGLADGSDEVPLRFLAEMIHPAVRTDPGEVQRLLALVNDHLAPDGYELAETRTVSGYPV